MKMKFVLAALLFLPDAHAETIEAKRPKTSQVVCVRQSDGAILSKRKCSKKETPLNLQTLSLMLPAEVGAKGDIGPKGEKGDVGPQGPIGLTGDKGEAGAQGIQGLQGPAGEKGDKGESGTNGQPGDKGPQGDPGTNGTSGVSGYVTSSVDDDCAATSFCFLDATCADGKKIISGGVKVGTYPALSGLTGVQYSNVHVFQTTASGPDKWIIGITNLNSIVVGMRLTYTCAFVQ